MVQVIHTPQHGSTPRIQNLRNRYVNARVTIGLERARIYTDVYRRTEAAPMVLRRAKAFKAYCENKTIRIEDGELLVASLGDRPRVATICPEIHATWLNDEVETVSTRAQDPYYFDEASQKEWREQIAPYWKDKTVFDLWLAWVPDVTRKLSYDTGVLDCLLRSENGPGYHTPGLQDIVFELGFEGLAAKARQALETFPPTDPDNFDKRNFLQAVRICCEGIIALGRRHAELARELAAGETDPVRRAELERIAAVCTRVPAQPPRDFYEACQMVWFVMMAIQMEVTADSVAVGRFDQFMSPYYEKDLADGTLTREAALELIENLWLKFYGNIWPLSEPGAMYYSGYHPFCNLTVGGVTPEGRDATNDLSYLCIEATLNLKVTQPSLATRLHKQTPQAFIRKNCELIRKGMGFPALHNDEPAIKMLLKKGVTMDEARDWNTLGCVEPSLAGKLHQWTACGNYNFGSAVEFALFNGVHQMSGKRLGLATGDPAGFATFEQFYVAVKQQLAYMIEQHAIASVYIERIHRDYLPCPFLSSLTFDCIESGKELMQGGARYNIGPGNLGIGLTDCVNSLMAVKQLVYDEQTLSWQDLMEAVQTDFANDGNVQRMLADTPKWGNDDDHVDHFGTEIVDFIVKEHHRYKTLTGKYLMPALLPVSSNVPMGKLVWALPSGRKAYAPLADGISPNHGTDLKGPTAVLKSVSKINHEDVDGGTLLNMKIAPQVLQDEEGFNRFAALVRTFVDLGVYHLQFNVVDEQTLRAAKADPEAHRSLVVRVAGYSAFFVELCEEIQDDIIGRTAHANL